MNVFSQTPVGLMAFFLLARETPAGTLGWPRRRESKDVVFEDVVFDNDNNNLITIIIIVIMIIRFD